ncbi:MAG: tRNA glutamyl-Q(34) synthetase GluQRS [Alphaproteobacteria bacterium]|nr:MAG: tRNA glutamyl-Q(34) synthetase GluQRS [Alphaproteobacteria bacterium]
MRTRFAPSPTGPLHLGHAYAAMVAHDMARAAQGSFLLRIEDIDRARARPEWEAAILDDLRWLGLAWDGPVLRQSDRLAAHAAALDRLWGMGLLYPCRCSRRDIAEALSAPQEGPPPPPGPDGPVYPGTCRATARRDGPRPAGALRLDLARALDLVGGAVTITEAGPARAGIHRADAEWFLSRVGDPVLARRDMGSSYHLAVVVDDAFQGITHVTRGEDLFEASFIHALLQRLLGLPAPVWHHHRLIRDAAGRRLAKRDNARALARLRAEGATPADIRRMVGLG